MFDKLRIYIANKLIPKNRNICVAEGKTFIEWTDIKVGTENLKESIQWFFYQNEITKEKSYRWISHGHSKTHDSHKKWLGDCERWKDADILPSWVQKVQLFDIIKDSDKN